MRKFLGGVCLLTAVVFTFGVEPWRDPLRSDFEVQLGEGPYMDPSWFLIATGPHMDPNGLRIAAGTNLYRAGIEIATGPYMDPSGLRIAGPVHGLLPMRCLAPSTGSILNEQ